MRYAVGMLVALSGCRSLLGIEEPIVSDGGTPVDQQAAADAPDGAPGVCYGESPFRICLAAAPTEVLVVPPSTIVEFVTTAPSQGCTLVSRSATETWCVLAAASIKVEGTLRATGANPFVLLGAESLFVNPGGTIDVSSSRLGPRGAGASTAACPPGIAAQSATNGAGGGAGGSFTSAGGNGGAGGGKQGGLPASPVPLTIAFTTLRGGCPGAKGGDGTGAPNVPGDGGGALYLLTPGTLALAGKVLANGAGGGGGVVSRGGGAGGGSGGMILLSAGSLTTSAGMLLANGGGGGGGADGGVNGSNGGEPVSTGPAQGGPPTGGTGSGSRGGNGGAAGFPAGSGAPSSNAGGGGGGGSVGMIYVLSGQDITGQVSPPPSAP